MRTPQNLWILCISSCVEYVVSTSNRPIRRAVNRVADHDAFAVDERDAKVRATFCSRLLCCWTNDDVTAHGECRPTTPKDTSSLGRWHEVKAQAWTHISFVREHKHDAKRFAAFSHHIFFKPFFAFARASKRFDEPIERCTWHERYPRRRWQRLRVRIGDCRSVGIFVRPPSCLPLACSSRPPKKTGIASTRPTPSMPAIAKQKLL